MSVLLQIKFRFSPQNGLTPLVGIRPTRATPHTIVYPGGHNTFKSLPPPLKSCSNIMLIDIAVAMLIL